MSRLTKPMLTACLLATAGHPWASEDEERLLQAVRKAYPATAFDRAARTPVSGLYALWMGENVAFVLPQNPRYMVFGRLVDLHTMQDLTATAQRQVTAPAGTLGQPEPAGTLPTGDAITVVRGNGRRKLVVFTDPSCGFCRRLDAQLRTLKDVTIHHFLVPFLGEALPLAIWCAPDRKAAYAQAMAGTLTLTPVARTCVHPLARNLALAARVHVQATPTLLFEDGQMAAGALSASEIEARLDNKALPQAVFTDSLRR
ncbi:DsbC family protein [Massilia sp. YIM B04103]|uniref:DsbC family protein n=1 Tax=Massilia sp. YIM B04103 TaxID=2963106 RepID=UPI00210E87EF|nr:DsbC family protein [Massilia sp. YIM B04103]